MKPILVLESPGISSDIILFKIRSQTISKYPLKVAVRETSKRNRYKAGCGGLTYNFKRNKYIMLNQLNQLLH